LIVENNISENNTQLIDYQTQSFGITGTQILGNISLNDKTSFLIENRGSGIFPTDTTVRHFVSVNPISFGITNKYDQNTNIYNATVIGGSEFWGLGGENPGGGTVRTHITNSYVANVTGTGFLFSNQTAFSASYTATFGNATAYFPAASNPNITNEIALGSQELGSCRVFVPDSATGLKGAGDGGADVGANILYAYIGGVLQDGTGGAQTLKLWDTTDGSWIGGRGATIAGVNDSDSLIDLHARLHSGCTGTAWPAAYRDSVPPTGGTVVAGLTSVVGSGAISVTVDLDDGTATVSDWVGIFAVGAAGTAYQPGWQYLSGTQVQPAKPVTASTVLNFTAPAPTGSYEFRAYCCDSTNIVNLIDESGFTVLPGTLQIIRLGTGSIKLGPGATLKLAEQSGGGAIPGDDLLLETGDHMLNESAELILME
jgi:hypothetical protein